MCVWSHTFHLAPATFLTSVIVGVFELSCKFQCFTHLSGPTLVRTLTNNLR